MKRIAAEFENSELKGKYFPVDTTTQKILSIESSEGILLPIFSTKEKLDIWFKDAYCQEILDQKQFLTSLMDAKTRLSFHLALDPHMVDGNLRFQLIPLDKYDLDAINGV